MRKPFGREVQAAVLLQCRRRCAFCFALEGDLAEKSGQIAHVDDPQDVQVENAAWLCRKHHDKYDRKSRQTKGYTPGELREYHTIQRHLLLACV